MPASDATEASGPITLLNIGAHPADVFDQSGGTMAHHVARGDRVAAAILTHGARVHDAVISDEMFRRDQVPDSEELSALMQERADNKAQEVRRACQALGFDELYFLGLDDAVLLVTEEADALPLGGEWGDQSACHRGSDRAARHAVGIQCGSR